QLQTQALSVTGKTVSLAPMVLDAGSPQVLSVSLDLPASFSVSNSVTVTNPVTIIAPNAAANPPVAPAVGQPETGSVNFLVGTVSSVDTTSHLIALQPPAGEAMTVAYDVNNTSFVNCDPT